MKLTIYVHDFHLEIGHTRAMIDLLNHLTEEQKSEIKEIEVVSFTATDPKKLLNFPKSTSITCSKVPFPGLYPFFFKAFFYQVWTGLRHLLKKKKGEVSLSIGIAFPFPDIVNIQFIHHHWDELNQLYKKASLVKKWYKKILFGYFNISENFTYKRANTNFLVLSRFTKEYLEKKFQIADEYVALTYSNVNEKNFFVIEKEKKEILKDLGGEGEQLQGLNFSLPIFLFVGAFERKGLDRALAILSKFKEAQLIVVGKPESGGSDILNSSKVKIFYVPFTKQLNFYYNLADYFIFPTYYEPFGLVILEAAITGLPLIIPRENVGASELLLEDRATQFIEGENFTLENVKILSREERIKNNEQRRNYLKQFSWEKSAAIFYQKILQKYIQKNQV
jgi:glycosyltransferase involved in cell wall biosynthesis